ncbi:MAG: hypothetical protein H7138_10810 [Myxococcales bacterium]|nr:hypothetical protein [Myxococcales bacterium]
MLDALSSPALGAGQITPLELDPGLKRGDVDQLISTSDVVLVPEPHIRLVQRRRARQVALVVSDPGRRQRSLRCLLALEVQQGRGLQVVVRLCELVSLGKRVREVELGGDGPGSLG